MAVEKVPEEDLSEGLVISTVGEVDFHAKCFGAISFWRCSKLIDMVADVLENRQQNILIAHKESIPSRTNDKER